MRQETTQPELRFPYNHRILLAFWRAMYFRPGEYQMVARQSPQWNRGAYLVQGLRHCSACHTSRDALGGTATGAGLAGATIPVLNWHAASLTFDPDTGLGAWAAGEPAVPETLFKQGARLYEQRCADCHKADGKGAPPAYPPLAGNAALSTESPLNPIRMVLNGGFPPSTAGNPRPYGMPPFGLSMTDQEIAAVVTYIRTSWGNKGRLVLPFEVERAHGVPGD